MSAPSSPPQPPAEAVSDAVRRALADDLGPDGDVTSSLLDPGVRAEAAFVARQPGVLAGTACATEAFAQVDPSVSVRWAAIDGAAVEPGRVLGEVEGPLASLLTAERTALNLLGHLSGVASLTASYVAAVAQTGAGTRIWDTRKTTPGLRALEKAAVRAGGGWNHRMGLSDAVMLKDNHLSSLGIAKGVARSRSRWPDRRIHVECDRLDQVAEAVEAGADAVLLDNMTPQQVGGCVSLVDSLVAAGSGPPSGGRPIVEVSGGIDLSNVAGYALAGVDYISVGRLTSSAPTLDIGLDITPSVPSATS